MRKSDGDRVVGTGLKCRLLVYVHTGRLKIVCKESVTVRNWTRNRKKLKCGKFCDIFSRFSTIISYIWAYGTPIWHLDWWSWHPASVLSLLGHDPLQNSQKYLLFLIREKIMLSTLKPHFCGSFWFPWISRVGKLKLECTKESHSMIYLNYSQHTDTYFLIWLRIFEANSSEKSWEAKKIWLLILDFWLKLWIFR